MNDARQRGIATPPVWLGLTGLAVLATVLVAWTGYEARQQRLRTVAALELQARLAAHSLGPALAATAAASRELDEIVAWKLLDNARLLAWMDDRGVLDDSVLEEALESNGLDLIAVFGADGTVERTIGERCPADLGFVELKELLAGRSEEAVFEQSLADEPLHVAAAVARAGGGALLARTHAETAYAFAQRLGVPNLLGHLVGEGGVLYAAYIEEPGGMIAAATHDGGPLPHRIEHAGVESFRGQPAFEVAVPVSSPAGRTGELHVGFDATFLEQASLAGMLRTALIGLVLAACGLVGVGVSLVQRQRLREREDAALRIAEEEDRRRRSERLASAGALAAGVAHEVRNPLNAISVAAQRLERCDQIGRCCKPLATTIRDEVLRLDLIVRGFLDLARPTFGSRVESDAADIVRDVLDVLGPEAASRGIGLRVAHQGSTTTTMDREAVRRAVVNLVRNAMQASPKDSTVKVVVSGDDSTVRVKVADRGGGIDPALGDNVFDPFVTGRAEGTGLGLALVRRVAEDHGGWATLTNRPDGGVEAVLELRRGGPP